MTQKVSAFSSLRTVLRCIPCVLTALGFLIMAVFLAPSASAHDVLVSSDPDDGEEVEAPSEFSITFNNDPIDMESAIVITGPDGDDAEIETDPIVEGRDVYTELPDLEPGEYDVTWRVVSSDGHPISGEQSFTVTSADSDDDDAVTDSDEADDDNTADEDSADETTQDDDSSSSSEDESDTSEDATATDSDESSEIAGASTGAWIAVIAAIAAALVLAGLIVSLVRKKKKSREDDAGAAPGEENTEADADTGSGGSTGTNGENQPPHDD